MSQRPRSTYNSFEFSALGRTFELVTCSSSEPLPGSCCELSEITTGSKSPFLITFLVEPTFLSGRAA